MEGVRSLYGNMLDGLKMKQLNERVTNLDGIYVLSIINYQFYHFCFITKKLVKS